MKPLQSPFSIKKKAQTLNFRAKEQTRSYFFDDAEALPLVVSPAVPDLDPFFWAEQQQDWIHKQVARYGAVLFRGFAIEEPQAFQAFAAKLCHELFAEYGDLPKAGNKIYKVTPYPPDKTIYFHNESSHLKRFPSRQFFYCKQPAAEGGRTPIVDCQKLYQALNPSLVDRLSRHGLTYCRHFIPGIDVSWQEFFHSDNPQEVTDYCRAQGIDCTWEGEALLTRQNAPAVIRHPDTGALILFNQIQLHHPAFLDPAVREQLETLYTPDRFPRQVTFGNGDPIDDDVAKAMAELYWQHAVSFPWQHGDVLLVDNLRISHGRLPYTPPRAMFVAMGDLIHQSQVSISDAIPAEALAPC